jgi:hypothetical protein
MRRPSTSVIQAPLALAMLIGYGSQCWNDEVTPSGVECSARVFSTPDANVESRNLRHSLAKSDSILLAGTSFDFLDVLRKVRGSKVQVISCDKHLLLTHRVAGPFGVLSPLFGGICLILVTRLTLSNH